jgi:hypothetical protein
MIGWITWEYQSAAVRHGIPVSVSLLSLSSIDGAAFIPLAQLFFLKGVADLQIFISTF